MRAFYLIQALLALTLFFACTQSAVNDPITSIEYRPNSIFITLSKPIAIHKVELFAIEDDAKRLVYTVYRSGRDSYKDILYCYIDEDAQYEIALHDNAGHVYTHPVKPASSDSSLAAVSLQAPWFDTANAQHDTSRQRSIKVSVSPDSPIVCTLFIQNLTQKPIHFGIELSQPSSATFNQPDLPSQYTLKAYPDSWFRQWQVSPQFDLSQFWCLNVSVNMLCHARQNVAFTRQLILDARHNLPEDTVSIEAISLPADQNGRVDVSRKHNTLIVYEKYQKWLREVFGLSPLTVNPYNPRTYVSVALQNASKQDKYLVIESKMTNPSNQAPVQSFQPPVSLRESGGSLNMAKVPPGETKLVGLPVYLDPFRVQPGHYALEVKVKEWGVERPLALTKQSIEVLLPDITAYIWTFLSVLVTSLAVVLFIILSRRIFALFTVRELVEITVIGVSIFILVSIPSTLLFQVLQIVSGPFAPLFSGILTEVVYYALLTQLLIRIPKPLTFTLAFLIRFLLGSVLFGQFQIASILYIGTQILIIETALLLFGLTRFRSGYQLRSSSGNMVMLALVLGLADAFSAFLDFQLLIVLFRLFYADWFIWLTVILHGFLYTVVGVLLGSKYRLA